MSLLSTLRRSFPPPRNCRRGGRYRYPAAVYRRYRVYPLREGRNRRQTKEDTAYRQNQQPYRVTVENFGRFSVLPPSLLHQWFALIHVRTHLRTDGVDICMPTPCNGATSRQLHVSLPNLKCSNNFGLVQAYFPLVVAASPVLAVLREPGRVASRAEQAVDVEVRRECSNRPMAAPAQSKSLVFRWFCTLPQPKTTHELCSDRTMSFRLSMKLCFSPKNHVGNLSDTHGMSSISSITSTLPRCCSTIMHTPYAPNLSRRSQRHHYRPFISTRFPSVDNSVSSSPRTRRTLSKAAMSRTQARPWMTSSSRIR